MATFVRISALLWADILASFAMFVMMTYLTNVWNLSTTHAAGIINIWNGIASTLTIPFAFLVDAFIGNFSMLLLSSIAYSIGLGLLSMSTPPVIGPCNEYKKECVGHTQKTLFYVALALIAVGMAGHVVSLSTFLDQQKNKNKDENNTEDENELKKNGNIEVEDDEEGCKIFWQIPGALVVVIVSIAGGIALPYIKPWSIRFGIPAICTVLATLLFLTGTGGYKYVKPDGSPLTATLRVFVASISNISQPQPDQKQPYNDQDVRSTSSLRCLDKAAIKLATPAGQEQVSQKWKLCTVREVEDTKIGIRMVPMWTTFIVFGLVLSIGNTYFLEQANHMDQKLGSIKIPIPIFLMFYNGCSGRLSTDFYNYLASSFPEKYKKYAPPVGIATSMVFSVVCCITAAKIETRRLHVIRDHGLLDKPDDRIPMSIFWLLPQFILLAIVDGMAKRSISGFFNNQVPESMVKYLTYFTKAVLGLGTMASVLSVFVVGKISAREHKPNWFQFTLNRSRLDRYYWTLAGIGAVNLVIYVIVACFRKYKDPVPDRHVEEGGQTDEGFQGP